jgi:hypothetical protein
MARCCRPARGCITLYCLATLQIKSTISVSPDFATGVVFDVCSAGCLQIKDSANGKYRQSTA